MTDRPLLEKALAPYPAPADTHPLDPDRTLLAGDPVDETLLETVAEALAAALAEETVFASAGSLIVNLERAGLHLRRNVTGAGRYVSLDDHEAEDAVADALEGDEFGRTGRAWTLVEHLNDRDVTLCRWEIPGC